MLASCFFHVRQECRGVAIEGVAATHDVDAHRNRLRSLDLDRKTEAVKQLRPQFPLFRIAGSDQNEACGVTDAEPLALDQILPGRRRVEQQIDEVILQQVDLVDIEKSAVRLRQQARLEGLHSLRQGPFEVERTDHPILGRAERQVDHRNRYQVGLQRTVRLARAAFGAKGALVRRVAAIAASHHGRHLRQQRRKRPDGRRLPAAAIPEDEHAANGGIDRRDQNRQLHLFLTDDRRKWIHRRHGQARTAVLPDWSDRQIDAMVPRRASTPADAWEPGCSTSSTQCNTSAPSFNCSNWHYFSRRNKSLHRPAAIPGARGASAWFTCSDRE